MAPVAFHGFERAQRVRGPLNQIAGSDVAEVVSGKIRQKIQADVGWGGSMRNHLYRVFLVVIRWQPVILQANELLEKCPRFSRQLSQENGLSEAEPCLTAPDAPADPPGNRRRRKPEA